ncbi:hypothetical protein DPEC_G00112960 [Dallia pectoralis]|uniref:Uncharacterized protein n=1 Tax=Dallia pectoralis TaxID=75939 RepID=A0ACC2GTQ3_DALPE|nr:hypothetical protein DPEC_G00112960 [Dallia pectoralis]
MVESVQQYVKSASFDLSRELRNSGVTYINARGEILKAHTVQATDVNGRKTCYTAETLVIATGGRVRYPNIPGAREKCITSDDLISLAHSPGRTLVVGESGEGLECVGFLSGLGLEVTVLLGSRLLPGFDHKMAKKIENHMLVHSVRFLHHHTLTEVRWVTWLSELLTRR